VSIEDIKRNELTPDEQAILAEDKLRWARMGAGGHLDDWLAYQPGLVIRRRMALKLAYTPKPEGSKYNKAFKVILEADGIDQLGGTAITALLWLAEDPVRMETLVTLRAGMTPGEKARFNSPITARQKVEKALKGEGNDDQQKEEKVTPLAKANASIVDLEEQLSALTKKLDKAEEGSLFDLKNDTADDIAMVIVNNVSEYKVKAIIAALSAWVKDKKKQPAPAG
jgi:hypothetical protein